MTDAPPALYRQRDFSIFLSARFLATIAMQIQSVAVGWQVYDIARDPLALGLVGLCQFAPMFLLTLPAGDIVDRFDQRRVFAISLIAEALCGVLFLALTFAHLGKVWPFYAVLILFGAAPSPRRSSPIGTRCSLRKACPMHRRRCCWPPSTVCCWTWS